MRCRKAWAQSRKPAALQGGLISAISANLHQAACAMKSASIITWRNVAMQQPYHYVKVNESVPVSNSTHGLVASRSCGSVAAAWVAMRLLAEENYPYHTRTTMEHKKAQFARVKI